jgi:hypothetical protein
MPADRTERLNAIVKALNDCIDVVRAYELEDTAALLRMAKLDLQMQIHDISEEELQALCEAVEEGQLRAPTSLAGRSGNGEGLGHGHASLVLPSTPASDRILLPGPRPPKRSKRM